MVGMNKLDEDDIPIVLISSILNYEISSTLVHPALLHYIIILPEACTCSRLSYADC